MASSAADRPPSSLVRTSEAFKLDRRPHHHLFVAGRDALSVPLVAAIASTAFAGAEIQLAGIFAGKRLLARGFLGRLRVFGMARAEGRRRKHHS